MTIITDWKRCQYIEDATDGTGDPQCALVAWYRVIDPVFGMTRVLCRDHYEKLKEFLKNWELSEIKYHGGVIIE